jgi:hypothetical protein
MASPLDAPSPDAPPGGPYGHPRRRHRWPAASRLAFGIPEAALQTELALMTM